MKNKKTLSLFSPQTGGGTFSAATLALLITGLVWGILLLLLSSRGIISEEYSKEDWYLYSSFLLSPLALGAVLCTVFSRVQQPFRTLFPKTEAKYYFIALLLAFGLLSLSRVNDIFLQFLQKIGFPVNGEIAVPSMEGGKYFLVLLAVGVLPAAMEETLFRGVVLSSLKGFGTVFAVLTSGALFALFHQNPAQTVYQFICGCVFALLALRSGSVFPGILVHFLNNAVVLYCYREGISSLPLVVPILSALAFVAALVLLFLEKKGANEVGSEGKEGKKKFFLYAALGICVCAFFWIGRLFGL